MCSSTSLRRRTAVITRCAAAAAALLIGGTYASAQTQLLQNPGFEAGVDGSPNAATGDAYMGPSAGPWYSWDNWAYNPVTNPNAEAFYTQSVPAHSGVQVAKTYGAPNGGVYQYVNINPYDAYTASGWFLNASSDALEAAETDDIRFATWYSGLNGTGGVTGGSVVSPTVSMSTPQNTWTQVQVQAAAPAGTQSVQWMAFFNNPLGNGGSMFVDDASLLDTSWNGGGADNLWSDNSNWGGVAPGQYAPVVFAGTNQLNSFNNTAVATPYYGIAFTPTAGSYTLTGNQVNLASDVNNYSTSPQTIALPLGLQQNTNFNAQAGNITVSGAIGGAFSVTTNGPNLVTFSAANTYSGGTNLNAGTLAITSDAAINDGAGGVAFGGGTLQLDNYASSLTFSSSAKLGAATGAPSSLPGGAVSGTSNSLTFVGPGTLDLSGGLSVGGVNVTGGTLQLGTSTGLSTVSSLSVSGSGHFDVNNNHVIINYGSPANDPIASIAAELATGYAGGLWNGPGIDSSMAAANSANYGLGYADSADPGNPAGLASGTIEIKYTLLGDVNLDGVVNGTDFGILAANFNKGVTGWDKGDFVYANIVNATDFGDLAKNFNKGASGASIGEPAYDDPAILAFAAANGLLADVPEPASATLILLAAAPLLSRRIRRRRGGSI